MDLSVDFEKHVKALSHTQLVKLVNNAAQQSPFFRETVISLMPVPDLSPVVERLRVLQYNISMTFPRNIRGNEDSSSNFLRVRAHLVAFKKECLDFCQQFMESQHWPSIFEYLFLAWKITLGLPKWRIAAHNKIRNSCIIHLQTQFITAFKKSTLDNDSLNEVMKRLEELDNKFEVKTCVTYARKLRKRD